MRALLSGLLCLSIGCANAEPVESSTDGDEPQLSEEQQLLWEALEGNTPAGTERFVGFALERGFLADEPLLNFFRDGDATREYRESPAFMELVYFARLWFADNPEEVDGLALGDGDFELEVVAQLEALIAPTLAQWDARQLTDAEDHHRIAAFCAAIIIYYLVLLCQRSTGGCRTQLDRLLDEFCSLDDGTSRPSFCDSLPNPLDEPDPDPDPDPDPSGGSDTNASSSAGGETGDEPMACSALSGTAMGECGFPDQLCTCCGCFGPGGYDRVENCDDVFACPV